MFAGWSHTFALTFQAARSGSLIFDQLPGIQAAKTPQTAYPNEKYGNWTSKKNSMEVLPTVVARKITKL